MAATYPQQDIPVNPTLASIGQAPPMRVLPASLAGTGILVILLSAWAGVVPFVGPSFGFSADGAPSWHWSWTHAMLGLAPGAVALVAGLVLIRRAPRTAFGSGRGALAAAAVLIAACGGWLAIGPVTWPVLDSQHYFVGGASPLHELAYQAGYSLGPGALLVLLGGFALGWAARHQRIAAPIAQPTMTSVPNVAPVVEPLAGTGEVLPPEA